MTATSVTGVSGPGIAVGSRGPDGGKGTNYLTKSDPHVVASGVSIMKNNDWKLDVIFPEPLKLGSHKYSVQITPQIAVSTNFLYQDGDYYYDYGTGGPNYDIRVNKLDSRWTFDSEYGTDGAWHITEENMSVTPDDFIGFTIHLGTSDNESPRPSMMWVVTTTGYSSDAVS